MTTTFKFIALSIVLVSFLVLKGSAQSKLPNVIGIHKSYDDKITPELRLRLDSTIQATADRFNSGMHAFKIDVAHPDSGQNIRLTITKGKLATRKQRAIAYLVNIIVPVYIPMHKIKSSISYPRGLLADYKVKPLKSSAHILVGNISKREEKLLDKYADKLLKELNDLDKQMDLNYESSIK